MAKTRRRYLKKRNFSLIAVLFEIILSTVGCTYLYIIDNILWIYTGFCTFLSLGLLIAYSKFNNSHLISQSSRLFKIVVIYLVFITTYITSIYSLILIIMYVPIQDKSILSIPTISIILILLGSTLGLAKDYID